MDKLNVPDDLHRQLLRLAQATSEVEVCGFLAGCATQCRTIYPIRNISPTPEHAYYMDPHSQYQAMLDMRRSRETMLAIYHSHPHTQAIPSPRDLAEAAYPGVAYVIISLLGAGDIAAFAYDGQEFCDLALTVSETSGGCALPSLC